MDEKLKKLIDELPEVYQKVYRGDELGFEDRVRRGCEPRLAQILDNVDVSGKRILDIGSNMGYFSLSLAERGAYVVGIEPDDRYRNVANYLAKRFDLQKRVIFLGKPINSYLTNFLVRNFAHFDIIIYLSLWHHFMGSHRWERFVGKGLRAKLFGKPIWRLFGFKGYLEKNQELLLKIARLGETMFFETGQSDEDWCRNVNLVPEMGKNIGQWIMDNILGDDIFYDKKIIGKNVPHTSRKPRYLINTRIKYPKEESFFYPYQTFPSDTAIERDIDNLRYKIDVEHMRLMKEREHCIDDPDIFPSDCGKKYIFGGNLNDLLWAGADLDYPYLAHSLVDKLFLLHERHSISLHDLRPWNIVFSLRNYDLFLIDLGEAVPLSEDPKSDILFLRLTLYHMLQKTPMAGEPLFETDTLIESPERFVKRKIGDFAEKCITKKDFHDMIDNFSL